MFRIDHDDVTLKVGQGMPVTWRMVRICVVETREGIEWDYQGETKLIPVELLEDLWRINQAHAELERLGRTSETTPLRWITWEQTISVDTSSTPILPR